MLFICNNCECLGIGKNNIYDKVEIPTFDDFRYLVDKLNILTKTDILPIYAPKLLDTIHSGSKRFIVTCRCRAYDPNLCRQLEYKQTYERQAQDEIKKTFINGLGEHYGILAFDEGVKNANEYNPLSKYDTQERDHQHCIFLLGRLIISLQRFGYHQDEYYFADDTLKHIPNMGKLKEKAELDMVRLNRRNNSLCLHCGGEFKGVFNKVCSKCGKPKDY